MRRDLELHRLARLACGVESAPLPVRHTASRCGHASARQAGGGARRVRRVASGHARPWLLALSGCSGSRADSRGTPFNRRACPTRALRIRARHPHARAVRLACERIGVSLSALRLFDLLEPWLEWDDRVTVELRSLQVFERKAVSRSGCDICDAPALRGRGDDVPLACRGGT